MTSMETSGPARTTNSTSAATRSACGWTRAPKPRSCGTSRFHAADRRRRYRSLHLHMGLVRRHRGHRRAERFPHLHGLRPVRCPPVVIDSAAHGGVDYKRINVIPLEVSAAGSAKPVKAAKSGGLLRLFWETHPTRGQVQPLCGTIAALAGGSTTRRSHPVASPARQEPEGMRAGATRTSPFRGKCLFSRDRLQPGGEGTAGPGADVTSGSRCGALP